MDLLEQFKKEDHLFPSRNIDPKLKLLPEYGRKMCEATYSTYIQDFCAFPFSGIGYYDEVRDYMNGCQDPAKYEDRKDGIREHNHNERTPHNVEGSVGHNNERRTGSGSINKKIVGLGPKILTAVLGMFEELDYDVQADTIDPDSTWEKERKKSETFAIGQHINEINMFQQNAGLPTNNASKYPRDVDELELMEMMGDFKTSVAKGIEKICQHTYEISNWPEIRKQLIRDALCYERFVLKDYYDDEEHKMKTKYIDVTRFIAQYSDEFNFDDSSFFGYVHSVPLSSIRHKLEQAGYSEEQISNIAQNYSGLYGNPIRNRWDDFSKTDRYGNWLYDFYKVSIYELDWIDTDDIYRMKKVKDGQDVFYNQRWGETRKDGETIVTTVKRKYECKWIIGTNFIYDHRISPSQPRTADNKWPLMPYHIYNSDSQAIFQRLMPVFDNFQIGWLKYQAGLQELHDEFMMVDISMLERINIGGKEWTPIEILEYAKSTKTFFYRSLMPGKRYEGGNVLPINKLPSTMMDNMETNIRLMENALKMIEYITGINPISLGQTPPSGSAVGTTESSIQATQKILKPIIDNIIKVKKGSATYIAEASRLTIRNYTESFEAYAKVIGYSDTDAIKQSEYEARELGIYMIPRPTTQDKQLMMQQIMAAMQDGRDGKNGIDADVGLYLQEKLMSGSNLRDIRLYLSNAIKKNKELNQKNAERNQQLQGQINQQNAQAKTQGDITLVEANNKAKLAEIQETNKGKLQIKQLELGLGYQNDSRLQQEKQQLEHAGQE
jgi:hypothetical protein